MLMKTFFVCFSDHIPQDEAQKRCFKCEKVFKTKYGLKLHLKEHFDERLVTKVKVKQHFGERLVTKVKVKEHFDERLVTNLLFEL